MNILNGTRYLVVLAHGDDEIFCASLLKKLTECNAYVKLVVLTQGELGFKNMPSHLVRAEIVAIRNREFIASCTALGITNYEMWSVPDGGVAQYPHNPLVQKLVAEIRAVEPDTIISFALDGFTGHIDHISTYHRICAAMRRSDSRAQLFGITLPKERVETALPTLLGRRKTVTCYHSNLVELAPREAETIIVPCDLKLKQELVKVYESQALTSYLSLFQLPEMTGEHFLPINPRNASFEDDLFDEEK